MPRDVAEAVDIAEHAGQIVDSYFDTDRVATRAKGEADVVTAADLASEQYITTRLRSAFPADGVVGEEGADLPASSGRRWYIDPVDGTLNFSRGLPVWCVSLSLFLHDRPVLGVIRDTLRDETFWAAEGFGAWVGNRRMTGTRVRAANDALVHVTVDFHRESQKAGLDDLAALAPHVLRTRNVGSAALALAWVAAGRFDGMIHRFAHPWDYGAGAVLVRESGGEITDLHGGKYHLGSRAILAGGNGAVHSALARVLRDAGRVE